MKRGPPTAISTVQVEAQHRERSHDSSPSKVRPLRSPPRFSCCWTSAILLLVMVVTLFCTNSRLLKSFTVQQPRVGDNQLGKQQASDTQQTMPPTAPPTISKKKKKKAKTPKQKEKAKTPKQKEKANITSVKEASNKNKKKKKKSKEAFSKITSSSSPETFSFRRRGLQLNNTHNSFLAKQWGRWHQLQDPKAPRPALPCHGFDHCDVPRDKFPPQAWQSDAEYLKAFLSEAQMLVTRAQEAILAEYGQSKFDIRNKSMAERSVNVQLDHLVLNGTVHPPNSRKVAIDNGGWTTPRSFKGLVRRLLHAIMTQDTFTFALGGHSAAAGHGNPFKQSYAMQFHRVMEPIFGRLGVQLYSYNFGKGGSGTTQDSMGMSTLWGNEIDFCMWDAGMLEFKSSQYDLFARQALIGGNRVPILWNGFGDVMEDLHNGADVDIGAHGSGLLGIPYTLSEEHANTLPHAVRFLRCQRDRKDLCEDHKYNGRCWVHRPDFDPPTKQSWSPGGGMLTHPGFRAHQLTGRVLAFTILTALQEALLQWKNSPEYALPDSAWHVSAYYKNIRDKLSKLNTTACFNETLMPSPRICSTPMKGVSEFSPRAKPEQSSIRSIMKDTSFIKPPTPNCYNGPDVYNPFLEPPAGEIDYLAIIENDDAPLASESRRRLLAESGTLRKTSQTVHPKQAKKISRRLGKSDLSMGRGWALHVTTSDVGCNGTYDSECGRHPDNTCLLYGHNDNKGGLIFDSFSGWMLMRLKDVKEGLIILKIVTWQYKMKIGQYGFPESSELTEGWTEENNGMVDSDKSAKREQTSSHRRLDVKPHLVDKDGNTNLEDIVAEICPEFQFDVAINGRIQTWSKDEFLQKRVFVHTTVEAWTVLDDPNFTSGKEMEVELGIRMRGCKRINSFKLTHVYWA